MNISQLNNSPQKCDVLIIGSGISGVMMASRLIQIGINNFIIIDMLSKTEIFNRADKIPYYNNQKMDIPNVSWDKNIISMKIWDNGNITTNADVVQERNYANKITNTLCNTTISSLKDNKIIYVPKNDGVIGRQISILKNLYSLIEENHFIFGQQINAIDLLKKTVVCKSNLKIQYKFLISSMYLSKFLDVTKLNYINLPCRQIPFYISINKIKRNKGKYEVFYCPDINVRFNRAALLSETLYLESKEYFKFDELSEMEKMFLNDVFKNTGSIKLQELMISPYPRFVSNEIHDLNKLKLNLNKKDVFLIGRYGNWHFELSEDTWKSTEDIAYKINLRLKNENHNNSTTNE